MSYPTDELTCNPIDSYTELMRFLKNPPPWRSLCKELTPHSEYKINNMDMIKHSEIYLDAPETFCHISPDAEDPPRTQAKKLPKTLVCHDMANGYHDDSYVDGTEERNAYTFYNWAGIDIFCYFSHHLITIPPVGWINVAHAHGVKVIGTLITEWNEGVKFWDEVLESESMFQGTASALVSIAKCFKFDGWLLNIENKISKPDLLLQFVQHLRYLLHQEIPHSELIWYDSVTIDGHLNWQNGLNDKNKAFFDACDGIFTNYSWTEFDITTSAIEAGDRLTDLYIGIDVWGRNFYGGGRLNTQAAIKVAFDEGCSVAIFAPAWTHEALSSEKGDPNSVAMAEELDKGEQFRLRDRALWDSFWPFLSTRLPCQLPFKTSFCRGLGKKRRMYGEVMTRSPWFNLRHQQYQPNSAHGPHGYLVSSGEVVLAVSTHGMYKDVKGILRVRESFQASRIELFSLKPKIKDARKRSENDDHDDDHDDHEDKNSNDDTKDAKKTAIKTEDNTTKSEEKTVHMVNAATGSKKNTSDDAEQETTMKASIRPTKKRSIKESVKDFFCLKSQGKRVSVFGAGHKERETDDRPSLVPKRTSEPGGAPGEHAAASTSMAGPGGAPGEHAAASASTAGLASSGKSMLSMSVNLRLGQGSAGPRAHIALAAVPQERPCLEEYQEDSFVGGSCVRVHPSDELCGEHRYTRLLHCDFLVRHALVVCVATKTLPDAADQYLTVKLHTVDDKGGHTRVVLVGRSLPQAGRGRAGAGGARSVPPLDLNSQCFKRVQRHLLLHETGFYVPVENYFGWTVRYYTVELPGSRVTSVNLRTGMERGPILLGHFAVCHLPPASDELPASSAACDDPVLSDNTGK